MTSGEQIQVSGKSLYDNQSRDARDRRPEPGSLPRPAVGGVDGVPDSVQNEHAADLRDRAPRVPELVPDQRPRPARGEAPARRAVLPLDGGAELRADDAREVRLDRLPVLQIRRNRRVHRPRPDGAGQADSVAHRLLRREFMRGVR